MKKGFLATILLGLILVLAACNGNDDSDTKDVEGNDSTGSSEETASNDITITATNFEFDQSEYTVKSGEKVKITLNNAEGMHGIAIEGLDVDIQGNGEATFTPTEPGEYKIYCNIPCGQGHDDMMSTLIVQ